MGDTSSITVTAAVLSKLRELARAKNTDIADVLAEAIGLEDALVKTRNNGSRMLLETQGGRLQQLVPTQRGSAS